MEGQSHVGEKMEYYAILLPCNDLFCKEYFVEMTSSNDPLISYSAKSTIIQTIVFLYIKKKL